MTRKLSDGVVRVGHLNRDQPDSEVVSVQVDDRGALITCPRINEGLDAFRIMVDGHKEVPRVLRFLDHEGGLTFAECRHVGTTASTLGVAVERIRSNRIIASGTAELSYDEIDGMTSEIDGLATWARMSTVSQSIEPSAGGAYAVIIRAENPDGVELGGALNPTLETGFTHNPQPKGNVYAITDIVSVRTRSESLIPWAEHAVVHGMLQDLMCLVYGKPCSARLSSVKREDDQPYVKDGDPARTWREVYEPSFGRSASDARPLDRMKDEPLFYLADVDRDALQSWMSEWDRWSRPTWIAVTTMFQRGTTVEARLLQIGVALESLGYALWQSEMVPPGADTPTFPQLLTRVTEAIGVSHPRLFGDQDASGWRANFNTAFKGAKHADNPLPDGISAHQLATQGMNLIRTWLAVRLRVPPERLLEHLDRR